MPIFDLEQLDTPSIALIQAALPLSLSPVIAAIGLLHTLALVDEFGGMVFVPPKNQDKSGKALFAEIESVIGFDATIQLGQLFNSGKFSVPRCQKAKKVMRDIQLLIDFDFLTKHASAAKAVNQLAKQNDLSYRQVEMIVNGKAQSKRQHRPCQVVREIGAVKACHVPATPAKPPAVPAVHGTPTIHTAGR